MIAWQGDYVMSYQKQDEGKRKYVLFYPVYNLEISTEINSELQIENVLLINSKKIPYVARKRFGLTKTISEIHKAWRKHRIPKLFSDAPTYAVAHLRSTKEKAEIELICRIKDSLKILASSQFNNGRYNIQFFGLSEHIKHLRGSYFYYDKDQEKQYQTFKRRQPYSSYKLDSRWKKYMKNHFFFYLLKILNNKTKFSIKAKWKTTLRNAAILAGESHFSKEISQAFIYNFIAIDSLLTMGKERYPDCIIDRLNAFFGWLTQENPNAWNSLIKELYRLRCNFVHNGSTEGINTKLLIESDNILFNLLYNICRFIHKFPSKTDLLDFSRKIEARRVLGQKVKERPGFRYSRTDISQPKISRIKKENNWP